MTFEKIPNHVWYAITFAICIIAIAFSYSISKGKIKEVTIDANKKTLTAEYQNTMDKMQASTENFSRLANGFLENAKKIAIYGDKDMNFMSETPNNQLFYGNATNLENKISLIEMQKKDIDKTSDQLKYLKKQIEDLSK